MSHTTHDSPIGRLTLAASDTGLAQVSLRPARRTDRGEPSPAAEALLDKARRELDEYFAGRRRKFGVPVDLSGVEHAQRTVLEYLASRVGYGETTTYGAIAAALELGWDGPRQVGAAMARNPVSLVVPCHRVLGAGGKLTGYAGGLPAKRWLLDLENQQLALAVIPADLAGHLAPSAVG